MLYIAGDHYAVELMKKVERYFNSLGIDYLNLGSSSADEQMALQEIIPGVVENVRRQPGSTGILSCGTGAGVEIGANRFRGIRACLCSQPEQARNARVYDNANVLCLGSWIIENPEPILEAWLGSEFDGDELRAKMLKDFDSWQ